jgi:hypothetical protein
LETELENSDKSLRETTQKWVTFLYWNIDS